MKQLFPNVFFDSNNLLTPSLTPGTRDLSELLVQKKGEEFRVWEPQHSKLAAAIMQGLKELPIRPGSTVLYLGAANGNTVSFVSDIVGRSGVVYALEVSERAFRELVPIAERRGNIVPVLADARVPQNYSWIEPVDCIIQDVATNDQVSILVRNAERFLKPGGIALLSLKSRSIDSVRRPSDVYAEAEAEIKKHFALVQKLRLDPFEKDHAFYAVRRR